MLHNQNQLHQNQESNLECIMSMTPVIASISKSAVLHSTLVSKCIFEAEMGVVTFS